MRRGCRTTMPLVSELRQVAHEVDSGTAAAPRSPNKSSPDAVTCRRSLDRSIAVGPSSMSPSRSNVWQLRARGFAQLASVLVAFVGISAFAAWLLEISALKSLYPPGPTLKTNAAIALTGG